MAAAETPRDLQVFVVPYSHADWARYELQEKLERSPAPLLSLVHGADDNRPHRTLFDSDAPLDLPGFIQEWNRRRREQSPGAFRATIRKKYQTDR
jgi:hypothetical protein